MKRRFVTHVLKFGFFLIIFTFLNCSLTDIKMIEFTSQNVIRVDDETYLVFHFNRRLIPRKVPLDNL
jgi:hypothetical protein